MMLVMGRSAASGGRMKDGVGVDGTVGGGTGEGVGLAAAVLSNNGVAVAEGVGNGRSVGGADVYVGVGEKTAVHPITPDNKIIIESSHTQ